MFISKCHLLQLWLVLYSLLMVTTEWYTFEFLIVAEKKELVISCELSPSEIIHMKSLVLAETKKI